MPPRIYTFMPFCQRWEGEPQGSDLGMAYNNCMSIVPDGDWACFIDSDAAHTTRYWFRIIEDAIEQKPEAGAFCGVTHRGVKSLTGWQMAHEVDHDCNDMFVMYGHGKRRFEKFGARLTDVTKIHETTGYKLFTGFCFVVSKTVWGEIGGAKHGFYGVDYDIAEKILKTGRHIYLMPGLLLYHWCRWNQLVSERPASMGGMTF